MNSTKLKALIKEEIKKILREASSYPETAAEYADQLNQDSESRRTGPDDFIGNLAADGDYWAQQGVHTGEDLAHFLAVEDYVNTYKEFYGFKPRGVNLKKFSIERLERMADTISGIDKDHVTHPPVQRQPSYDDEPSSTPPMEDDEAEELHQWVSKNRDKQNRRS